MKTCRPWWRNSALKADSEIQTIDKMEDALAPLDPKASKIRGLISSLELCHHKADRWIHNIIEAIGSEQTDKGLGTRPAGQWHPSEEIWQNACTALSTWCSGDPSTLLSLSVGTIRATKLLTPLGERSPLKDWQIQRVIEKIRSVIHWPHVDDNPATKYEWLLLGGGEYESSYRSECPPLYKEHEDFWLATVRTIIHDTDQGQAAELSLGLAIDMLWPCHWNFVENLQIVLNAIGGQLNPEKPFAACGRNITTLPNLKRIETICGTLRVFYEESEADPLDREIIGLLENPTPEKRWLAASLDKTIRLQANPSREMRAASALTGPEWIRH